MTKVISAKNISASDIAKYFFWKAKQDGKEITNKKLQKLLYYAQAWHLVFKNKPLFKEDIEAWVHGPTIRDVYFKYKKFGFSPINVKVEIRDIKSIPAKEILDDVWKIYGKFDGNYLEVLTHQEEPWQEARDGVSEGVPSVNTISHDSMKKYYSGLLS